MGGEIFITSNGEPYLKSDLNNEVLKRYEIGDEELGGIIAYIYQPGDPGYVNGEQHGLVAAPCDGTYCGSVTASRTWGLDFTLTGASGTTLGTGYQNSIINGQGASAACLNATYNGYTDWFLPSKDELSKLYLNKDFIPEWVVADYWSSSEYTDRLAWANGYSPFTTDKIRFKHVRAIRYF